MNSLGNALKQFRVGRGFTQQEVAERAGINKSLVSRAEAGDSNPRGKNLEKLAKGLDVPVSEIHRMATLQRSTGHLGYLRVGFPDQPFLAPFHLLAASEDMSSILRLATGFEAQQPVWLKIGDNAGQRSIVPLPSLSTAPHLLLDALLCKTLDFAVLPSYALRASDSQMVFKLGRVLSHCQSSRIWISTCGTERNIGTASFQEFLSNQNHKLPFYFQPGTHAEQETSQFPSGLWRKLEPMSVTSHQKLAALLAVQSGPVLFFGNEFCPAGIAVMPIHQDRNLSELNNDLPCAKRQVFQYDIIASLDAIRRDADNLNVLQRFLTHLARTVSNLNELLVNPDGARIDQINLVADHFALKPAELSRTLAELFPGYELVLSSTVLSLLTPASGGISAFR